MIGLGKLGLPCAEVMAQYYDVTGYDINIVKSETNINIKNSIQEAVVNCDIIFVAVPTPHDPMYDGSKPIADLPAKDFDYSIVQQVLTEINNYVNKEQLVVLISTVLPGTVRLHLQCCITNARFIYNPYLIAMGSVKWDMINPECIIIGTEDGSETGDAKLLVDFYKPLMKNTPRINIGTWDEAESIKIFYNTFISTKIGLVNMIQDVAEKNGNINVDVVTDALKAATQRITGPRYLTAGMGDAGACHPRDNIALRYLAERLDLGYDLFHAVMHSRDQQAKNMALKLVKLAKENNLPIIIHGRAYKPYVEYTIGSYSELVGHFVKEQGINVRYADPLTGDRISDYTSAVILLAHNPSITYYGTGVEVKPEEFYFKFGRDSIVVDPWRTIAPSTDYNIMYYGDTRIKPKINYDLLHAIPEIDSLLSIVKKLPKNPVIVEIGTYLGATTVSISKERPDASITTIDCCEHGSNWNAPYDKYVREYIVDKVLKENVSKKHVLENLSRVSNVNFIEGYSPQCAADWNTEIDLYFEDGDHGNPNLAINLAYWSKFVKVGGYLAAHDYGDPCPDVVTEIDKMIDNGWKKILNDRLLIILQKC